MTNFHHLTHGHDDTTDRELVSRFVNKGDHRAFTILFARHGPMVRRICKRYLKDHSDINDAVQISFLTLFEKAKLINDTSKLEGWLVGVAHRVANRCRRERDKSLDISRINLREAAVDPDIEFLGIIKERLVNLSPHHREVIVLCDLEERSESEAAKLLGLPIGTVRSRLFRGRQKLRASLLASGFDPPDTVRDFENNL